jgi:modulator of FtsH protease HflC
MKKILWLVGVIAAVTIITLMAFAFVVDETEQALVIRLGNPTKIIAGDRGGGVLADIKAELDKTYTEGNYDIEVVVGAGLYFKWPFIETVIKLEDRILEYDADPTDIVTRDKKHLRVDNFARWRIVDPLLFYETVRNESGASARLDQYIYSTLREELAKRDLIEIVRSTNRDLGIPDEEDRAEITIGRQKIMDTVSSRASILGREIGIEVIDVRIKRADLPPENEKAIFGRMQAERQRISKQYRSEGQELAQKIRAETDKNVKVLLADAYRDAEIIKGEADAKAAATYSAAYRSNSEFYSFVKALEAAKASTGQGTKLIMGTDSGLYRILTGKTPRF